MRTYTGNTRIMKKIPKNIFVEPEKVENKYELGKAIYDIRNKQFENEEKPYTDPIEQNRVRLEDRVKALNDAFEDGIKKFNGNFYVVILRKKEPLMQEVIRAYYVSRESCPAPNFDQDVLKYERKKSSFKLLWSIPDQETCQYILDNRLLLDDEDKKLFEYIHDYANGQLHITAMKENKEIE